MIYICLFQLLVFCVTCRYAEHKVNRGTERTDILSRFRFLLRLDPDACSNEFGIRLTQTHFPPNFRTHPSLLHIQSFSFAGPVYSWRQRSGIQTCSCSTLRHYIYYFYVTSVRVKCREISSDRFCHDQVRYSTL